MQPGMTATSTIKAVKNGMDALNIPVERVKEDKSLKETSLNG